MKKFFFLLAVILFIPFKVNALNDPVYFQSPIPANASISFNNYAWSTSTFQTINANSTYHFDLYGSFSTGMQFDSVYVRVSYCVDGSFTKGYSTDQNTIDIDSIRTSIPCEYYGSNYSNGRVAFTTWRYNTSGNASFTTRISFNAGNSNISIGLLGLDLSLSQFPLYSETDAILKSNDSLNNRLQTIINQNNTLAYKIDDTNTKLDNIYNFLQDNFTTCRQSKAIVDFSQISYVPANGATITRSNGEYSITNSSNQWGAARFTQTYLNLQPNTTYTFSATIKSTNSSTGSRILYSYSGYEKWSSYGFTNDRVYFTFTTPNTIPNNLSLGLYPMGVSNSAVFSDIMLVKGSSIKYEPYGQTCVSSLDEQKDLQEENNHIQQERNDFLNNDDTSESSSTGSDFFNSFNTSSHGLTGIITAPLNLITSITSKTCSPLVLPLPFVNQNIQLPCMSTIYSQYFGSFYDIYKVITFGIVAYWVCVRIFNLVKDFKNPEHDEIEVVDL